MAMIKTVYRRVMRHCVLQCILFLTFGIVCYLLFIYEGNDNKLPDAIQYNDTITFWSNDYHIR
jgi:hypothetical protein